MEGQYSGEYCSDGHFRIYKCRAAAGKIADKLTKPELLAILQAADVNVVIPRYIRRETIISMIKERIPIVDARAQKSIQYVGNYSRDGKFRIQQVSFGCYKERGIVSHGKIADSIKREKLIDILQALSVNTSTLGYTPIHDLVGIIQRRVPIVDERFGY